MNEEIIKAGRDSLVELQDQISMYEVVNSIQYYQDHLSNIAAAMELLPKASEGEGE